MEDFRCNGKRICLSHIAPPMDPLQYLFCCFDSKKVANLLKAFLASRYYEYFLIELCVDSFGLIYFLWNLKCWEEKFFVDFIALCTRITFLSSNVLCNVFHITEKHRNRSYLVLQKIFDTVKWNQRKNIYYMFIHYHN